ncbi:hypothetical protein FIBSPDRAFT_924676 [Athelia psychrophila]|uniref:Uncharacterized protein n=1 Tax=Athelia psychrophila TaxID=1759441 RepID=A0A166VVT1_9AGAM|nr:hypothetical protein FIBSPDRAFT_924676 [Fibularhizoctonia sp. CBS 109695]
MAEHAASEYRLDDNKYRGSGYPNCCDGSYYKISKYSGPAAGLTISNTDFKRGNILNIVFAGKRCFWTCLKNYYRYLNAQHKCQWEALDGQENRQEEEDSDAVAGARCMALGGIVSRQGVSSNLRLGNSLDLAAPLHNTGRHTQLLVFGMKRRSVEKIAHHSPWIAPIFIWRAVIGQQLSYQELAGLRKSSTDERYRVSLAIKSLSSLDLSTPAAKVKGTRILM